MGQGPSHLSTDTALRSGTYRIISGLTGTAIQVSDQDHSKIVSWERHEGEHQMWFLLRSGDGYVFKNRQHGFYLAVASTDVHTLVYASRYPTTWVLLKTGDCYLIKFPDNNRVLDLHFGWGNNGNEIHLWPSDGNGKQTWRLEHVRYERTSSAICQAISQVESDDTDEGLPERFQEEGARLRRDLEDKSNQLTRRDVELAVREQEMTRVVNELVDKERRLEEQQALLSEHEDTIRQLRQDVQSKDEALARAYRANEETSRISNQQSQLQGELSQQRDETASLRVQMDRFEYLMSQWFMQQSGEGYRFKNCRYGSYLTVDGTNDHATVYAGRYPATWVISESNDCYMIRLADNIRALDLHQSLPTNGNEIHIWPPNGNTNWWLQRLSDDTGEALPEAYQTERDHLQHELKAKAELISRQKEDLASQRKEIDRMQGELSNKTELLAEKERKLSQYQDTIAQLQKDLQAKNDALTYAYSTNKETVHLRDQQTQLQTKLSRQQNETAELQAKMDRFEYLMAQMMSATNGPLGRNNTT